MIRIQLYWEAVFWLLTPNHISLQFNNGCLFSKNLHLLNYLVPFFAMYFINAIIISISLVRIKRD